MSVRVSRKARRKAAARREQVYRLKKGTCCVGTVLLASAITAPIILPTVTAQAASQEAGQSNTTAYINELAKHAQSVASQNDLYASVMIAQGILESGWGASTLSSAPNYNLFGIKGSYNGQCVYMQTQEYLNNKWVTKNEAFRKYPSYAASFADNAYILRTVSFQAGVYYYAGAWKSNTSSYRDATAWLTGRYATDPGYAGKLNYLIETYNLTRFDTPATGNAGGLGTGTTGNTGSNGNSGTGSTGATQNVTYKVKAGDSLWAISQRYGSSIAQIKSWNKLSSDLIYVGQTLIVQKAADTPKDTTVESNTAAGNNTNKPKPTNQYYTVKAGDSVWLIADKYGISMDQLRQWNGIKNNMIHPGDRLIVKKGSGATTSTPSTSKPAPTTPSNKPSTPNTNQTTSKNQYYTVKAGDSVWLIADKYGISMDQLRQWNGIKNDLIHPGNRLIVKKGQAANNSSNSSTSSATNNKKYKVVRGDSLWGIAERYGTTIQQLKKLNNLSGDVIYVGQTLRVG